MRRLHDLFGASKKGKDKSNQELLNNLETDVELLRRVQDVKVQCDLIRDSFKKVLNMRPVDQKEAQAQSISLNKACNDVSEAWKQYLKKHPNKSESDPDPDYQAISSLRKNLSEFQKNRKELFQFETQKNELITKITACADSLNGQLRGGTEKAINFWAEQLIGEIARISALVKEFGAPEYIDELRKFLADKIYPVLEKRPVNLQGEPQELPEKLLLLKGEMIGFLRDGKVEEAKKSDDANAAVEIFNKFLASPVVEYVTNKGLAVLEAEAPKPEILQGVDWKTEHSKLKEVLAEEKVAWPKDDIRVKGMKGMKDEPETSAMIKTIAKQSGYLSDTPSIKWAKTYVCENIREIDCIIQERGDMMKPNDKKSLLEIQEMLRNTSNELDNTRTRLDASLGAGQSQEVVKHSPRPGGRSS